MHFSSLQEVNNNVQHLVECFHLCKNTVNIKVVLANGSISEKRKSSMNHDECI